MLVTLCGKHQSSQHHRISGCFSIIVEQNLKGCLYFIQGVAYKVGRAAGGQIAQYNFDIVIVF